MCRLQPGEVKTRSHKFTEAVKIALNSLCNMRMRVFNNTECRMLTNSVAWNQTAQQSDAKLYSNAARVA